MSTGVAGLDEILHGGLLPNRLYLVEGIPGSGKTTLALQFLLAGRERGERGLYITLSETADELQAIASSHGWSLDGLDLFEFAAIEEVLSPGREMTLLHPWEVELNETIERIIDQIERVRPQRVAFDSLSEMRLMAQDPLRYRRQVLALKQYFAGRNTTVLLLDDRTASAGEVDGPLHSLSHGVITLDRFTLDYGTARRRLQVQKVRGSRFREGWHDLALRTGGLAVYPRLRSSGHQRRVEQPFSLASGIPELDALLEGGPLRGTSLLLTGPAGSGKTTVAIQYVAAAARRGERSAVFEFDERTNTLLTRSSRMAVDLGSMIRDENVLLRQIDPTEVSPGEFADLVRDEVERCGTRLIVIDSLNGYLAAMPEEKHLLLQMHELLSYLAHRGVTTILLNAQTGLVGTMQSSLNISYVADTVILLRFFEAAGRVRKAISIIKNRGGPHEDTIRELKIDEGGVRVGVPLTEFHGVLTGTPRYRGGEGPLLYERQGAAVG